jgi:hypothetical protein
MDAETGMEFRLKANGIRLKTIRCEGGKGFNRLHGSDSAIPGRQIIN